MAEPGADGGHRSVVAAVRQVRGQIDYLAGDGGTVGRERFELRAHAHGGSLRAVCELDDAELLRDVTIAFDQSWRPLDGFCRVTRAGVMAGSSWFSFDACGADVESRVRNRGRMTQRFERGSPWPYLGLHPLQGDALVTLHADEANPGRYVAVPALTNSVSENGDQDLIATVVSIEVAALGPESISVRAGDFRARRFAVRWHPDWPPATLWVREEDCLFLKLTWEQVANTYELAELEEPGGG